MTTPTIVVFGVTGQLGSYVAKALVASYEVRGVTAELNHDQQIKELEDCGIHVQRVAFSDGPGLEAALAGAVGCFVVTDSDLGDPYGYDNEVSQGRDIAAACARARVPHVIYSTQLSVVHALGLRARHMDAKAVVESYMTELHLPLTGLVVPFFYENLLSPPFRPVQVATDSFALLIPMGATSLDAISVADIGGVVQYLFDHRDQFIHKTLTISGDKVTVKEMAASLTKHIPPFLFKDKQVSAQDVVRSDTHTRQGGHHFTSPFDRDDGRVRVPFLWRVYTSLVCLVYIAGQVTLENYRRMQFEGAEDLANMFDFYYHVVQRPSVDLTKRCHPDVKKFDDWVRFNAHAISLATTGEPPRPQSTPLKML
ncbi:NmrA-like family domain-containing protein 1 [Lamellibrachia satsuma]|nr:NmrA-like family domain-containing protein 1 [Lamellibrachia satsuma]